MALIWSDENRFRTWLAVEVAATETLAEAGIVPKDAARAIRERADFNVERIFEIEAEVKHDVIAFTTAVAEIVGPHSRWFHYGLTSNDVVDTAQALLIQQASSLIAADLERLSDVLEQRAWEFKDTPMIGRTHGVHAEPITFGFKIANWYSETQRNIARFKAASDDLRVGKFSGAVGTFADLSPELEEKIGARLGLKAAAAHSLAERGIRSSPAALAYFRLHERASLLETMFVYRERLLPALPRTRGLVFSGQLLLDLGEAGVSREDAYRRVQSHAMRAWKE